MADFTYKAPDPAAFLHTLRTFLEASGESDLASLLLGATCEISTTTDFSRRRWNEYDATITFRLPVEQTAEFDSRLKLSLQKNVDAVFPKDAGYDVTVVIAPIIEAPPDEDAPLQNTGSLVNAAPHEHDGLRFRSKTEIRVYDELKKRDILFFANSTAILGGQGIKREPDFLVCQDGKWGILEVMGDQYHTSANAMRDHDRARLFKHYRLLYIEFYDARRCYNETESVVTDFLTGLAKT